MKDRYVNLPDIPVTGGDDLHNIEHMNSADLVLFIHRPEYYGIDVDEEGNSLKGVAEIIVAKHRNGPTGDIHLKFVREFAKFVDMDDTLAMVDDDENGFTISSKMNQEAEGLTNKDIGMNNGFDGPAPF